MGVIEKLHNFGQDFRALCLDLRGFVPIEALDNNGQTLSSSGYASVSGSSNDLFDKAKETVSNGAIRSIRVTYSNEDGVCKSLVVRKIS